MGAVGWRQTQWFKLSGDKSLECVGERCAVHQWEHPLLIARMWLEQCNCACATKTFELKLKFDFLK